MGIQNQSQSLIFGCGDVGRRIVKHLLDIGHHRQEIFALVNSTQSLERAQKLGIEGRLIDLDLSNNLASLDVCSGAQLYYTVAPQPQGTQDLRSRGVLNQLTEAQIKPSKIVLISTTGVYGDYDGQWVDETCITAPKTQRGQRRLDSETQWLTWGKLHQVAVVILRVPGIYAFSRLPRERLAGRTPVVKAQDCGYSNRIHADDLARICVAAMDKGVTGEVYNASDGSPGKISEYLQAAAQVLGHPPLPEISMSEAEQELSAGMLSYLSESRKISNLKMLSELDVCLLYPDFREGLLK